MTGLATPDPQAALLVDGVCKSFGPTRVLRDISLAFPAGQFITLLGPSGCGKTTLLRIIAGLERPDCGRILLHGADLGALPANRRPINTVFQNYALFPHLDVYENIAFGLRSRRFAPAEIKRRVSGALEMLQLDAFAARNPAQLSGGQKQRVALARALVNEPELLLLDEPMSALDAKLRAEVQLELRRLQRRLGRTFILVTHDQDEAMTVSDRIIVMCNGVIEQSGDPQSIYERPRNRFVAEFLGSANIIPVHGVNGRASTPVGELLVARKPAWQDGALAIRPERIRVCAAAPAENAVRARIREMIYRGDHVDLFVEPGPLRVRTEPSPGLSVGAEIWLHLHPEHLEALVD